MISTSQTVFTLVFAAAAIAAPVRAGSLPEGFQPRASAAIVVDGKTYEIPLAQSGDVLSAKNYEIAGPAREWSARVTVSMNADPEIVYQASVVDFGQGSSFTFIFTQSIVATAAPGTVRNAYAAHTTDSSTDGTSVTPQAPSAGISVDADGIPEIAVYSLSNDGGSHWLNAGHDLAPALSAATPADTQGPFTETGAGPLASGSYNAMRVDVGFVMPGGEDTYSFSGRASLD